VKASDFKANFGAKLLRRYNDSVIALLEAVFPEYAFKPWLFPNAPHKYFESVENRRLYIEWLMERVKIRSEAELTARHFLDNNGSGLLHSYPLFSLPFGSFP